MSSKVYILVHNLGTNNESIFMVNDGEKKTVLTFETVGDARQYAVRLGENNFDVPGVGEVAMGNISQFCKNQGLGLEYIRQGESALVPQNNSLTTLANEEQINLVYSLLSDEVINYLWGKLQSNFGQFFPNDVRVKAQLGKIMLSTCLNIAYYQDEPIGRAIIKSTIRQAVALATDDIVEWLANWIVKNQQGDDLNGVVNWTTKAFMKLSREAMVEVYVDQKINQINARYGLSL